MKKYIITSVLAFSLFASFAPVAFAGNPAETTSYKKDYTGYTAEELTALIAQLTKTLEELKKQMVACFVSDKDLSLGDGEVGDGLSADVERLQAFLREKGYFQFAKNTGFFGKLTRTALISFQNASAISPTGDFDAATRAKAHAMTCSKATVKYEQKKEDQKYEDKKKTEVVSSKVVKSIVATVDYIKVRWTTDGYAKDGYKVVWSKNPGPTYPPRDGDNALYMSGDAQKTELSAFNGSGTYYARVCEYIGGACGVYSNEVQVQL